MLLLKKKKRKEMKKKKRKQKTQQTKGETDTSSLSAQFYFPMETIDVSKSGKCVYMRQNDDLRACVCVCVLKPET